MKKTKLPKGPDFFLSEEALETHINFLKEKDPSIMGATCQMLSALNVTLNPQEGLQYIYRIVEDMKQSGKWLSDEQTNALLTNSTDKYLPKILKDKKWIYSISDYITRKLMNSLRIEARRERRKEPLSKLDKHPEIEAIDDYKKMEDWARINEAFQKAGLTQKEKNIYIAKKTTSYTEDVIAKIFKLKSRDNVKNDYASAKKKLEKVRSQNKDEL